MTCGFCNGKILKSLKAHIDVTSSNSYGACVGDPYLCTGCDGLSGDYPLASEGVDSCCWSGTSDSETIACSEPVPSSGDRSLAIEVCLQKYDVDTNVDAIPTCGGLSRTIYTYLAGHYYVKGTVTDPGSLVSFVFVRDLGTTKPDCVDIKGDIPFAYWINPVPSGDIDFTDIGGVTPCVVATLSIS